MDEFQFEEFDLLVEFFGKFRYLFLPLICLNFP